MSYWDNPHVYHAALKDSAKNTPEALQSLVDSGALQGTLARHKYNEAVYWSPDLFYNGVPDSLDGWLYLGSLGWYPDENGKRLFLAVRAIAGDMWPEYPGEYSLFPPQLAFDI